MRVIYLKKQSTNKLQRVCDDSRGKNTGASVLTQIGLQAGLDVAVPLLKPLEHSPKKLTLILKTSGQVVHIGIRRLALEPYLGIRPAAEPESFGSGHSQSPGN
jgi:hypothetical protein